MKIKKSRKQVEFDGAAFTACLAENDDGVVHCPHCAVYHTGVRLEYRVIQYGLSVDDNRHTFYCRCLVDVSHTFAFTLRGDI